MRFFLSAAVMLLTAACASNIQTSSGDDYFARAANAYPALVEDAAFRKAANLEPLLTFPARIGIARVERGGLIDIPGDEIEAWAQAAAPLMEEIGEVVPVNPFIADLVAPTSSGHSYDRAEQRRRVIERIRLAGARQHLDAVFVYETYALSNRRNNSLSIADLTLIGGYLLPGRDINAVGTASAVLFDVRNNYPYATVTVSVDEEASAATFNVDGKARDLRDRVKTAATAKLAQEIAEITLPELKTALTNKTVEIAAAGSPTSP